jgi:hypothetical protein
MNQTVDSKTLGLVALGVLTALSVFQFYTMTKQIEQQNEKLIELASKANKGKDAAKQKAEKPGNAL